MKIILLFDKVMVEQESGSIQTVDPKLSTIAKDCFQELTTLHQQETSLAMT